MIEIKIETEYHIKYNRNNQGWLYHGRYHTEEELAREIEAMKKIDELKLYEKKPTLRDKVLKACIITHDSDECKRLIEGIIYD